MAKSSVVRMTSIYERDLRHGGVTPCKPRRISDKAYSPARTLEGLDKRIPW